MRAVAFALAGAVLLAPTAVASDHGLTIVSRDGARIAFVAHARAQRDLAFSGDGRLVSIGGDVVGHARLPTRSLTWAPTGERAAYITTQGGVVEWTPKGRRRLEPNGWGATSWGGLAWSRTGTLAVSRGDELWAIRDGSARRIVGPLAPNVGTGGPDVPIPFAWAGSHVLWWDWPGSGSVASDGVTLWADGTRLGTTLMYPEYTATCGDHVAFAQGHDRYSTDGKSLLYDARDVSRDTRHSYVEPACSATGRLVAAVSRNIVPQRTNETHRAIWQLLPTRRRLTTPPWGWSDEDPHLLPNGTLVFVRTRFESTGRPYDWTDTQTGRVMVLAHGKLVEVATIGYSLPDLSNSFGEFYGRYDWAPFLAIWP